MSLLQLLQVIWVRKRLLVCVLAVVVAGALTFSLLVEKKYTAEVSLVADVKGVDPVSGALTPAQLTSSYLSTQTDVIQSHNVALKVVEKLKLTEVPEIAKQFRDATDGLGSFRDWLADALLRNLDVKLSRDSSILQISFTSADPNAAADLANAFADAYIQTTLELKVDPARRQTTWFDEQLQGLRKTLQTAQTKLSQYQREHSVVGADDRLDVENSRLAEITNQLVTAQAAMYDAQTRKQQMQRVVEQGQLEQLPDVLGNSLLQSMKADLTRAEAKLAEGAERYGKKHPQYISSAAEVETLKNKLTAELTTVKGAINQAAQLAEQRVNELQRALDAQKARILSLKQQHDEFDVLNREVESAQRTYDAAIQRANQIRLESRLDQSSISILNPAIAPIEPSRPRVFLNTIVALVVGLMLATGVVLALELLDRRVRSSRDLFEANGIPVLAELPNPQVRAKRLKWTGRLAAAQ